MPTTDAPDPSVEDADAGPTIRPFMDFLREQGKGALHEELTEKLHELVGGVTDTNKAGTLTLTIKVTPMKGNPEVLTVHDAVKVTVPRNERRPSIFYPDDNGNLSKTDPNQPQLAGLKIAGAGKTKAAEAAAREQQA